MTTMSLKLEEELNARLTAVARRRGESRSAVAREARANTSTPKGKRRENLARHPALN